MRNGKSTQYASRKTGWYALLFSVAGVPIVYSNQKVVENVDPLFDPKDHVIQAALIPVDVAGDAFNALPEFMRDPKPEFDRINALNKLMDTPGELPKCVIVSSGDPFGE